MIFELNKFSLYANQRQFQKKKEINQKMYDWNRLLFTNQLKKVTIILNYKGPYQYSITKRKTYLSKSKYILYKWYIEQKKLLLLERFELYKIFLHVWFHFNLIGICYLFWTHNFSKTNFWILLKYKLAKLKFKKINLHTILPLKLVVTIENQTKLSWI